MTSQKTKPTQTVVLTTGNQGKVAEMQSTLEQFGLSIVAQRDLNINDAVEDGLSFVENAIIKARHASEISGLPAIADDSGLEVDALHGAPGIYSARYADGKGDDANNQKLLAAMQGVEQRTARFQCVIVFIRHATDPTPIIAQGTWDGQIGFNPKGQNGFGYDPLFFIPELDCNSAELLPETKKQISHRAKALQEMKQKLSCLL
jgi:XTP/dITP diphosphohydrolase